MSTKIYTGFRFKTNDLFEARKQILEFKKELFYFAQNVYYRTKVTEAVAAIDLYDAGLIEHKPDNPLSAASEVIDNQQKQIVERGMRNPPYDFSFSMTIFPIDAENKADDMYCPRTLLGMYFCENNEIAEFFRSFSQFWEPYIYEDQTDSMVVELGKEEYDRRGYHWELAMPFESTPSQSGFSIDLIPIQNGFYFCFRQDAPDPMDFIPDFEERCRNVAREKIGSEILVGVEDPNQISINDILNSINDEEKIVAEIKEIKLKLKKNLNKIDLYGFDPDAKKDKKIS